MKRHSDKAITLSSCINTAELMQVAHLDQVLHSEVDLTEKFSLLSSCVVILQLILVLLYSIYRLVTWLTRARGQLEITPVPPPARPQPQLEVAEPPVVPTHPRRNSVYFGYV